MRTVSPNHLCPAYLTLHRESKQYTDLGVRQNYRACGRENALEPASGKRLRHELGKRETQHSRGQPRVGLGECRQERRCRTGPVRCLRFGSSVGCLPNRHGGSCPAPNLVVNPPTSGPASYRHEIGRASAPENPTRGARPLAEPEGCHRMDHTLRFVIMSSFDRLLRY